MLNSQRFNITNKWLLLVLAIGVINVFIHFISLLFFAFLILIVQFIVQNKHDLAFTYVMFSGVFGAYFAQYGVRGVGTFMFLLGLIILFNDLLSRGKVMYKPVILSVTSLLFLLFSMLITTGGEVAGEKFFVTSSNVIFCLVAFGHLLLFPQKHNGISLALTILIYSSFMMSYMSSQVGGLSISDVLSFGSFRKDLGLVVLENENIFLYNYQQIGFCSCLGLCLFFQDKQNKLDLMGWAVIVISGVMVLACQSRQGLFSYAILLVLNILDLTRFKIRNILVVGGLILLAFFWLDSLDETSRFFITGKNEFESSSARSELKHAAWVQFLSHPIVGVGYGRFVFENTYGVNVHNMVYEILAETGIIGAIFWFLIAITSFVKIDFRVLIGEYKWILCVIIAYFLRMMISSDMREGIQLFIIILLLNIIKYKSKQDLITKG